MMKTIKVTSPLYVGVLSPLIQDLVERVPTPGVVYESLYTHLCNVVQFGGDMSEVWATIDDDDAPKGLAQWHVKGLPYISTTYLGFIYSTEGMGDFVQHFIEFGVKHRCLYYEFDASNEKLERVFKKAARQGAEAAGWNHKIIATGRRNLVVRRLSAKLKVVEDEEDENLQEASNQD